MAIIKKPQKNRNRKGTPPKVEEASNNLTNLPVKKIGLRKDLNVKVDPDFKKEFKNFATDNDLSMHDLLIKIFNFYKVHS